VLHGSASILHPKTVVTHRFKFHWLIVELNSNLVANPENRVQVWSTRFQNPVHQGCTVLTGYFYPLYFFIF
jgi:hypothetical protein